MATNEDDTKQYKKMKNMMQEAKYDNGIQHDHGNKQLRHTTSRK